MFPTWYLEYKNFIEVSINKYLEIYFSNKKYNYALEEIKNATFYALLWWKRIRSILALEFYLIFSWKKIEDIKENDDIVKFCISLELMHAYSLVHDDLPAMDNDEYRRWELTTWKKFWEANGILVWDLLNTLSFEVLSEMWDKKKAIELISLLSKATWFFGMIWWQVEDLFFERNFSLLDLEALISLHNKKTWALIITSVLGWIILSWKEDDIEKYKEYAKNIGLAFQIKDDILDVEWTFEETGKSVGWEKKWFVYFLWLDKSKIYLKNIINESFEIIYDLNSEKLNFLTDYIWNRKK